MMFKLEFEDKYLSSESFWLAYTFQINVNELIRFYKKYTLGNLPLWGWADDGWAANQHTPWRVQR